MNTYSLPEPVETTLYDVDGNRWDHQGHYWTDYAKNNYLFGTLVFINLHHSPINKQNAS